MRFNALRLHCPECGCARINRIDLMDAATLVVERKCGSCRTRWQVVVKPLARGNGSWVHEIAWTNISVPNSMPTRGTVYENRQAEEVVS